MRRRFVLACAAPQRFFLNAFDSGKTDVEEGSDVLHGAAFGGSPFREFSEKSIALRVNSCLQQLTSAFAQKISQRVRDGVSTGKIDDGSVLLLQKVPRIFCKRCLPPTFF